MKNKKIKMPLVAAIVTLAFTIGTTAFTKVAPDADTYSFTYQLTTYDQEDVADPSNWDIGSANCTTGEKACQMIVADQYTHQNPLSGERELNTTTAQGNVLTIETESTDGTNYKVASTTDATVANKN